MARAKRTERAEARRRYRAAMTGDPAADTIDGDGAGDERAARAARARLEQDARAATRHGPRRPDGLRRCLPRVDPADPRPSGPGLAARGSRSTPRRCGSPSLITVASTIAVIGDAGRDALAVHVRVLHPDAGHRRRLHRRASWRHGRAGCWAWSSDSCRRSATRSSSSGSRRRSIRRRRRRAGHRLATSAVSAFVLSPVIGGFFAAGAAWYRRFLAYSSPNRGRSSQSQKPTGGAPGDGRTRGSTSQKAGAKR